MHVCKYAQVFKGRVRCLQMTAPLSGTAKLDPDIAVAYL